MVYYYLHRKEINPETFSLKGNLNWKTFITAKNCQNVSSLFANFTSRKVVGQELQPGIQLLFHPCNKWTENDPTFFLLISQNRPGTDYYDRNCNPLFSPSSDLDDSGNNLSFSRIGNRPLLAQGSFGFNVTVLALNSFSFVSKIQCSNQQNIFFNQIFAHNYHFILNI